MCIRDSNVLANYARDEKRHQEARRLYDEVLRIHRDTGNLAVEGRALCSFGSFLLETGELWSAVRTSEAALERLRQTRDALFITSTLGQLAHANLLLGRLDEAEANLHDGFAVERESGLEFMRCQNLMLPLARLELELGHAVKGLPDRGECARRIEALAKDPALKGDAVLGRIKGVLDDLKREVEAARAENRLPCIFRGFLPSQLSEATRQAALAAMQEQSPREFKRWQERNRMLYKAMKSGSEGHAAPDRKSERV